MLKCILLSVKMCHFLNQAWNSKIRVKALKFGIAVAFTGKNMGLLKKRWRNRLFFNLLTFRVGIKKSNKVLLGLETIKP